MPNFKLLAAAIAATFLTATPTLAAHWGNGVYPETRVAMEECNRDIAPNHPASVYCVMNYQLCLRLASLAGRFAATDPPDLKFLEPYWKDFVKNKTKELQLRDQGTPSNQPVLDEANDCVLAGMEQEFGLGRETVGYDQAKGRAIYDRWVASHPAR